MSTSEETACLADVRSIISTAAIWAEQVSQQPQSRVERGISQAAIGIRDSLDRAAAMLVEMENSQHPSPPAALPALAAKEAQAETSVRCDLSALKFRLTDAENRATAAESALDDAKRERDDARLIMQSLLDCDWTYPVPPATSIDFDQPGVSVRIIDGLPILTDELRNQLKAQRGE